MEGGRGYVHGAVKLTLASSGSLIGGIYCASRACPDTSVCDHGSGDVRRHEQPLLHSAGWHPDSELNLSPVSHYRLWSENCGQVNIKVVVVQCVRKVFRPLPFFHILLRNILILKLIT